MKTNRKRMEIGETIAKILLLGMTLLMPEINQGMEEIKKDKFALLKAFYGEKNEFAMSIDLQQYFFDNFKGQVDLVYMEDLLRRTLSKYNRNKDTDELNLFNIKEGEEYKLWALPIPDNFLDGKVGSPFFRARKQFKSWATMMREYVELELRMPKAGSKEEEPYLFKEGWFDISSEPANPLPYFNDHDFYLSDFITQEIWIEVMGTNPSDFPNKFDCPKDLRAIRKLRPGKDRKLEIQQIKYCKGWAVTNITLCDAQKFVHIMNMGSPADVKYDIPTEWQFDLAARGGIVSETENGITNTGRYGSLDVTNMETFKEKISWTGDLFRGPGRTKQKPPFPRLKGPHDLIGHLYTWTKSLSVLGGLAGLAARRSSASATTKIKNWGLEWNLEKKGDGHASYGLYRVLRGGSYDTNKIFLNAGIDMAGRLDKGDRFLGLRLLRTTHK